MFKLDHYETWTVGKHIVDIDLKSLRVESRNEVTVTLRFWVIN